MLTLRPRLSLLLFLCALAPACAPRSSSQSDHASLQDPTRARLSGPTVLEFLHDDQPLLVATIPGIGELTLLLDTGAQHSWIDLDFARQVNLPREPLGATLVDIQGVRSEVAERAVIERLEVGGLDLTNFRPPLIRTLRDRVHGSLGQDVLGTFDCVIDGPGRRLILLPKGTWEQAQRELFEPGNAVFSYKLDTTRALPMIRVGVADLEGHYGFDIDTGSSPMTFSPELVNALALEATGTEHMRGLSHAKIEVKTYFVRELALELLTVTGSAQSAPNSRLGWGVLRETVCVFPQGAEQLLLFVEPAWSAAWDPERSH